MKIEMRGSERELTFLNLGTILFAVLTTFALTLFVGPISQVQGQAISIGPTVSLASLTNGTGISAGDKFFDDFTISGSYSASDVSVTPIEENSDYGIRFGGAFSAIDNETSDLILGYNVTVVTNAPLLISQANLLFDGVATGSGLADVVEQVFNSNSVFLGQMFVFATSMTNQDESSLLIQPPQQQLILSKDVLLQASFSSFTTVSTIDQTFTQVVIPEPSALALSIAGLAGLCLLQRRSRSSRRTDS